MRNVRVLTEDGWFDSKAELKRHHELQLLERAGEIHTVWRQIDVPLLYEGQRIGNYRADFIYLPTSVPEGAGLFMVGYDEGTGKTHFAFHPRAVVEDVKGQRTALYSWKARHFKLQYGFAITEINVKPKSRKPKKKRSP